MKVYKFFDLIGNIDDELIKRAEQASRRPFSGSDPKNEIN